jgi:serine/threonine protein kinase
MDIRFPMQVLQGIYTSQADLWSVGVITYMLLSAHRPFYNKSRKVMIDKIMRCDYDVTKDYWMSISDTAKDMVSNLLVLDPKLRMDADKALQHPWLSRDFALSDRKPCDDVSTAVGESLVNFKHTSALKKIALNVSALRDSRLDYYFRSYVLNAFGSTVCPSCRSSLTDRAQMTFWN